MFSLHMKDMILINLLLEDIPSLKILLRKARPCAPAHQVVPRVHTYACIFSEHENLLLRMDLSDT